MKGTSLMMVVSFFIIPLLSGCLIKSAIAETSSISMATDKKHYFRGEMIKLLVTNNLDTPIWYIGYPQPELVFWKIERAKDDGWLKLGFRLPLIEEDTEVCRITMYERPIGVAMELRPNSDLLYEWNQKMCLIKILTESVEPETLKPGRYRFLMRYSFYTVKSENVETQPWKRPIDLGEIEAVYSNEFILE